MMLILRHTTRLRTAETIVRNMSDMILDFHIFVEGDLTKIGLLLADLAPSPHTGDVLPMEMTRSLLQCYSGTVCSFPNILRCLKRFIHEHDSEDRLTREIAGHLLPSQSRPELPSPTDPPPRHQLDTSMPGLTVLIRDIETAFLTQPASFLAHTDEARTQPASVVSINH